LPIEKVGINMSRTIKPESVKNELLHNERWEDEGGATVSTDVLRSAGRFVRSMPKATGLASKPRQWNTKFSIESFSGRYSAPKPARNDAGKQ
jgi:hypothetical protein